MMIVIGLEELPLQRLKPKISLQCYNRFRGGKKWKTCLWILNNMADFSRLSRLTVWLVSTCERLSVMHEPAGVVEILVQIQGEYPLFWNTEYPPPWKLSESPSPSTEYPPKMKIVRESKSKYRIPPPPMKIVRESKSKYRIPPPNENCQRVQVWVQNTPPPPKSGKLQISNFRIVLQSGRSYVETNL